MNIKCKRCNGNGSIEHPLWSEYFDKLEREQHEYNEDDKNKWFSSIGYDVDDIPEQEIVCPRCNGSKEIPYFDEFVITRIIELVLNEHVNKRVMDEYGNEIGIKNLSHIIDCIRKGINYLCIGANELVVNDSEYIHESDKSKYPELLRNMSSDETLKVFTGILISALYDISSKSD